MPWWATAALAAAGIALMVYGLCRAAAAGDAQLRAARRNLKGPEDRERVGL